MDGRTPRLSGTQSSSKSGELDLELEFGKWDEVMSPALGPALAIRMRSTSGGERRDRHVT